jgi:hypothetical protein
MLWPSANLSDVSIQSTLPSLRAMKPSTLAAMWIVTWESGFAIVRLSAASARVYLCNGWASPFANACSTYVHLCATETFGTSIT